MIASNRSRSNSSTASSGCVMIAATTTAATIPTTPTTSSSSNLAQLTMSNLGEQNRKYGGSSAYLRTEMVKLSETDEIAAATSPLVDALESCVNNRISNGSAGKKNFTTSSSMSSASSSSSSDASRLSKTSFVSANLSNHGKKFSSSQAVLDEMSKGGEEATNNNNNSALAGSPIDEKSIVAKLSNDETNGKQQMSMVYNESSPDLSKKSGSLTQKESTYKVSLKNYLNKRSVQQTRRNMEIKNKQRR
jgi:hypothetical protein